MYLGRFLAIGLVALVFPSATSADPAPSGDFAPDPQLVAANGPVSPVPDRVMPGTDLGVRISSLPGLRVPGPGRKGGSWTARIITRTAVLSRPGGARVWVARGWARWSGGTQQLLVLGSRLHEGEQWLRVRLPGRPNGGSGWLPRDRAVLGHSPGYLVLDRSRRMLSVYRNGRRMLRFRVVVGKRSTPTPLGLFAIYDRVRQADPRGFIGPWALPLTAHSERLKRYDGGPGLIAFHGRDGASLRDPLGSARSHGCIRMNNGRIRGLTRIPLGTAVRIRR